MLVVNQLWRRCIVTFFIRRELMKKIICWIVWVLMVIGSINWGLVALGKSLFGMAFFPTGLIMPVQYLVGLAGLASLVMFFMGMYCPDCDKCK